MEVKFVDKGQVLIAEETVAEEDNVVDAIGIGHCHHRLCSQLRQQVLGGRIANSPDCEKEHHQHAIHFTDTKVMRRWGNQGGWRGESVSSVSIIKFDFIIPFFLTKSTSYCSEKNVRPNVIIAYYY